MRVNLCRYTLVRISPLRHREESSQDTYSEICRRLLRPRKKRQRLGSHEPVRENGEGMPGTDGDLREENTGDQQPEEEVGIFFVWKVSNR